VNEPINAISKLGSFIARTYSPGAATRQFARQAAEGARAGVSLSNPEGIAQAAHNITKNTVAAGTSYFTGSGHRGLGKIGTSAARIAGAGATLQGTSRILRGQSPIRDESGDTNLPGIPFI